jgi:hypothetical protein
MGADLDWNFYEHRPSAGRARMLVLEQHMVLRDLLNAGIAEVRASEVDNPSRRESLGMLVRWLRDLFVQHLADEEALIVPILEDDLPLGPCRAAQLRDEHLRQRREFDALCDWPDTADEGELAARFDTLATALLGDMAHEEWDLLTPDIIRDDCVVVDQSSG